ncbi:unnamed protein product [Symbiodinium sp. KB8]|nr:unnamed protein product [Symbiodinium sp. KB8]
MWSAKVFEGYQMPIRLAVPPVAQGWWGGWERVDVIGHEIIFLCTREGEPEVSSLVKQESEPAWRPSKRKAVDAGMNPDIEASLLQPYPEQAPVPGSKLHVGTLLHGLVELLRDAFGCNWPQHCIAMIASTVAASIPARGTTSVGDLGYRLPLGDGFCDNASLMRVQVPHQTDDWSCGHLLLAAARCVIGSVQRPDCEFPPALSKKGFSDDAVTDTVAYLQKKWQGGSQDAVKHEQAASLSVSAVLQLLSDDDDDEDDGADQADKRVKKEENAAPATPRKKPTPTTPKQKARKGRFCSPPLQKQVKPKAPKQREDQERKEGARLAKAAGVSYNSSFQLKHQANLDANPSGHWLQCRQLREIVLAAGQKQDTDSVLADGDASQGSGGALVRVDADDAVLRYKRGRPPKNAEVLSLQAWVNRQRKGVYKLIVPELDTFSGSFRRWEASGQLSFSTNCTSDPLQLTSIAWRSEDLLLRHTECLAQKIRGSPACLRCVTLAQSRALHVAVTKWSFRFDLATYGRALAISPEAARTEAREVLLTADYRGIPEIKRDMDGHPGKFSREDLDIASKIAVGGLKASKMIHALLASFLESQAKRARGAECRPGTGKFMNEELLREICFQLGSRSAAKTILKVFGVATPDSPAIDFRLLLVPWPFLAEVGLQHLAAEKTRSFFISVDETCFHATWSLVAGLSSRTAGGPDKPKKQLEILGMLFSALTDANDGRPPLGASYDGGGCNLLTSQTFLAMRPASELAEVAFSSDCKVLREAGVRFFPYGILTFASLQAIRSTDSRILSTIKRFTLRHATGTRSISWGSTATDLVAMLECHMPVRAFLYADVQSDREALQRLHGAPGASIRPSRFAERAAELHFTSIKKNYRGSPNLRNILVGSHWHHLQQVRKSRHGDIKDLPDLQSVAADRARHLAGEAYQHAARFQAWVSVNRTPNQVAKEFEQYREHEGHAVLGSTGDADDPGRDLDPEALMSNADVVEDEGEADGDAENMQEVGEEEGEKEEEKEVVAQMSLEVVQALSDVEDFDMGNVQSTTYSRCLKRLAAMQPLVRKFVAHFRLEEGKQAPVMVGADSPDGTVGCQCRAEWSSSPPPLCCASTDDSLQLAVVQSVFRGAKLKDSRNPDGDKITRKMRVTKPAASPLPATSTARVRLAHLTWIEDSRYFACALSPVVLCDPCGCVVAEVPVKQVSIGSSKLLLWFSPEVTGGAPEAGRSPAKQRLWSDAGMTFLDGDSKIKVPKTSKLILWEEINQRAPDDHSNKQFGSAVLTRCRSMLPGQKDALQSILNLVNLVGQIDAQSLPASKPQPKKNSRGPIRVSEFPCQVDLRPLEVSLRLTRSPDEAS